MPRAHTRLQLLPVAESASMYSHSFADSSSRSFESVGCYSERALSAPASSTQSLVGGCRVAEWHSTLFSGLITTVRDLTPGQLLVSPALCATSVCGTVALNDRGTIAVLSVPKTDTSGLCDTMLLNFLPTGTG